MCIEARGGDGTQDSVSKVFPVDFGSQIKNIKHLYKDESIPLLFIRVTDSQGHHIPQEAGTSSGYEYGPGSQIASLPIFTLSFISDVSNSEIINLFGMQFPICKMRVIIIVPTSRGGLRIK